MNVLQTDTMQKLLEGDIFGFVIDTLTGVIPIPILALLIFGSIGIAFYMTQNSFIIPGIMLMLIGGVTIAEAPPTAYIWHIPTHHWAWFHHRIVGLGGITRTGTCHHASVRILTCLHRRGASRLCTGLWLAYATTASR